MSDNQLADSTVAQGDPPGALRVLALVAVSVGVAALAGAAFVLSYSGLHAFAVQAGISGRLARGYPLIFDVLLAVILAAVLFLRGAGLPSKVLAWTCLLALLAAAAGADALHAAGGKLPAHAAAVTAAVVPWVVVFAAFVLLLAMLRQARQRRLGLLPVRPHWQPQLPPPLSTGPLVPGFGGQVSIPSQVTAEHAADAGVGLQADPVSADLAADDIAEEEPEPADSGSAERSQDDVADEQPAADEDTADTGVTADTAVTPAEADDEPPLADEPSPPAIPSVEDAEPEMPVFHRMWSSPTPPAD